MAAIDKRGGKPLLLTRDHLLKRFRQSVNCRTGGAQNHIDEIGEKHVGVIAQELQAVHPEMVSEGNDGYLRVDPNEFLYMLINATKEQQNRIEILEAEISKLKVLVEDK